MSLRKMLFLAFLLLYLKTTAQFLRNDFETYSSLPDQLGQWYVVHGLLNPSVGDQQVADPDYFHSNANYIADLPETAYGLIAPHAGFGIVGFEVANQGVAPGQEYISFELPQPLIPGKSYHLQFYWSNGKHTPLSKAGLAVANFGVLFSSAMPVQQARGSINEVPNVVFENSLYSEEWRQANITFEATDSVQFITMGVFGETDLKYILKPMVAGAQLAYYYIDDVQLWVVDQEHPIRVPWVSDGMPEEHAQVIEGRDIVYVPNSFTPNDDGKNDYFLKMEDEVLGWELEMYNRWGEVIYRSQHATAGWDGKYQGGDLEEDIYYWQLTYFNPAGETKKCSGNVFLIR